LTADLGADLEAVATDADVGIGKIRACGIGNGTGTARKTATIGTLTGRFAGEREEEQ
jgi:hypothetical protein